MAEQVSETGDKRFCILVADDESGILGFLAQALTAAGYDIVLARDGQSAVDAVHRSSVDLLLLDLWMPRMSGFEVVRKLASNGIRPPIIAMSAAYSPDRDGPLGEPVVAFLPKPFDLEDLLDLVRRHLPGEVKA